MPMDAQILAAALKDKVIKENPEFSGTIGDQWDWLFSAVSEAVIEHIKANMIVTGSTSGASGIFTSTSIS